MQEGREALHTFWKILLDSQLRSIYEYLSAFLFDDREFEGLFFYTNGEPMRICYDGYSENEIRFEHFGVIVRGSAIGVGVTTIGIELLIGSMGSLRHISEL